MRLSQTAKKILALVRRVRPPAGCGHRSLPIACIAAGVLAAVAVSCGSTPSRRAAGCLSGKAACVLVGHFNPSWESYPRGTQEGFRRLFAAVNQQAVHKYAVREWPYNQGSKDQRPDLCLSLSGGGIRSAAFAIGVLSGLEKRHALEKIDRISAVSGGSWALAWFYLQQRYAREHAPALTGRELRALLFDEGGPFQKHLRENAKIRGVSPIDLLLPRPGPAVAAIVDPFQRFKRELQMKANGRWTRDLEQRARDNYEWAIVQAFQASPYLENGGPTSRGTDGETVRNDDAYVTFREMAAFAMAERLPLPIFGATVDIAGSLPARAFEMTAVGMGSDATRYISWSDVTDHYYPWLTFNVAPLISSAALDSSNLDRGKTRGVGVGANADRLGYPMDNFSENVDGDELYLTDGGHSENLGLLPLIRRACRRVIVVDAEHEPAIATQFASYRSLKANLQRDLHLDLRVPAIDRGEFLPDTPVLMGEMGPVPYSRTDVAAAGADPKVVDLPIRLAYIKLSLDRDRIASYPWSVRREVASSREFPQHPTTEQRYPPARFDAYRDLGEWLVLQPGALDALLDDSPAR